jgi:hypothetical protein
MDQRSNKWLKIVVEIRGTEAGDVA